MKRFKQTVSIAFLAVLAIFGMTACSSVSTQSDIVSLHYSGGPFSSIDFQDCVPASTKDYNGPGDKYYNYPISQRDYDATGGDGADANPVVVTSSDNAELSVPLVINFELVSDCDTLVDFHENLGNRYHAYWDKDAKSDESPAGWGELLRKKMGTPAAETLRRVAQKYPWRAVWNDPDVKREMETEIQQNIAELVNRQAGGEYFEGFEVLMSKPDPVNQGLKDAIAQEQQSVAKANSEKIAAEAEVTTAKAKAEVAEAQLRIAQAEARKRAAEIQGYGGSEAYLKKLAIDNGLNPYQPTYGSAIVDR